MKSYGLTRKGKPFSVPDDGLTGIPDLPVGTVVDCVAINSGKPTKLMVVPGLVCRQCFFCSRSFCINVHCSSVKRTDGEDIVYALLEDL